MDAWIGEEFVDGRIAPVSVCAACPECHRPIGALVASNERTNAPSRVAEQILTSPNPVTLAGFEVIETWPAPVQPRIPANLPPATEKALGQAERAFARGDLDAAGIMYRRSLESGLKLAFPNTTGLLYARIETLVAEHKLPPAIGEWAHEVRIIGNEAAHDEEGTTLSDVKAMRDFVDAVLRYAISLPEEIRRRRSSPDEAGAPKPV